MVVYPIDGLQRHLEASTYSIASFLQGIQFQIRIRSFTSPIAPSSLQRLTMETCGGATGATMIHLVGGAGCGRIRSRLCSNRRRAFGGGRGDWGFSDDGHLRYYARCGGTAGGEKRKKLIKKLSKDLEAFLRTGDECKEGFGVVGETIANKEAAEKLLAELVKMRAEEKLMKKERQKEKALKKNRKEEEKTMKMMKDKEKTMKMKTTTACVQEEDMSSTSSSDSSDSSDSECEDVVDISSLGAGKPTDHVNLVRICDDAMDASGPVSNRCSNTSNFITSDNGIVDSHVSAAVPTGEVQPANKIEVCVGGKCRKSGALRLMEEFSKVVANNGAVVGCKCMGKCREGPNVRVLPHSNEDDVSLPLPTNPLFIGVGLEDVQVIVSNYLRKKNGMRLLSA